MNQAIFEILADAKRRQILELLRRRPQLVGELTEHLGISQPGVSKHLRLLRDAGLVRVRKDAQRRWYELQPEPLAQIDAWLQPFRQQWESRYDRLDRYLQEIQSKENENE